MAAISVRRRYWLFLYSCLPSIHLHCKQNTYYMCDLLFHLHFRTQNSRTRRLDKRCNYCIRRPTTSCLLSRKTMQHCMLLTPTAQCRNRNNRCRHGLQYQYRSIFRTGWMNTQCSCCRRGRPLRCSSSPSTSQHHHCHLHPHMRTTCKLGPTLRCTCFLRTRHRCTLSTTSKHGLKCRCTASSQSSPHRCTVRCTSCM